MLQFSWFQFRLCKKWSFVVHPLLHHPHQFLRQKNLENSTLTSRGTKPLARKAASCNFFVFLFLHNFFRDFQCTKQFLSFVIFRHFFRNKLFTVSRFVYFVQKQTLAGKILLMQGPIFSMHDWLLIHFPNLSCSCAANFPASVFIKICSLLQLNFTMLFKSLSSF